MSTDVKTLFVTFWSLEPPRVRGRLRYHLGPIAMLERLRHLVTQGHEASCVICDPVAITASRARPDAVADIATVRGFLGAAADFDLSVFTMSDLVRQAHQTQETLFDEVAQTASESYEAIRASVEDCVISDQARVDLRAHRDMLGHAETVPSLREPLEYLSHRTRLPRDLVLSTLYAFLNRPMWFERDSLAAAVAAISCWTERSAIQLVTMEARRNAYSMLLLESLHLSAQQRIGRRLAWPGRVLTHNVPGFDGSAVMQTSSAESCVVLDQRRSSLVQQLGKLPPVLSLAFHDYALPETEEPDAARAQSFAVARILEYHRRLNSRAVITVTAPIPRDPEGARDVALILKGGGAKCLALLGSVRLLCQHYSFNTFVGTSGGAVVAALLAAGYTPDELITILYKVDFHKLFARGWVSGIVSLARGEGFFATEAFENWLEQMIRSKLHRSPEVRDVTLAALPQRAVLLASQEGGGTLVYDSRGEKRDSSVTHAVRGSTAIPFLFAPTLEDGRPVVDGGALNNYPLRSYRQLQPESSLVGVVLTGTQIKRPSRVGGHFARLAALYRMWTDQDEAIVLDDYSDWTVVIDPRPIRTLDLSLSRRQKNFLLLAGEAAAVRFLTSRGLVDNTEAVNADERVAVAKTALTEEAPA